MHNTIKSYDSSVLLSEIASNAGAIMLENGAEIYRVEDTIERIIRSKENIKDVDVYSTFNVIILSFSYEGKVQTNVRRVKRRSNNLYYVDKVNSFSRRFVSGELSLEEALKELDAIKNDKGKPYWYKIVGAGLAAGAYSLLLKGGIKEMLISFCVGLIAFYISGLVEKKGNGFFVVNFLYGVIVSSLTLLFRSFYPGINFDSIVIASIMAFLPGMIVTNAMRDLMGGDSTSGLTGAVVAILISTAIAMGVGIPITMLRLWG